MCLYVFLAFFAAGCVSQSFLVERLADNSALSAPAFGGTLSSNDQFKFIVVGDLHISGSAATFSQILSAAGSRGNEFAVLLGDLIDGGERSQQLLLQHAISSGGWSGLVFPVIGNHDIFHDGWSNYKEFNGQSRYSVDIGNSRLIVLDTADGTVGAEQTRWFEQELASSTATNVFVASHYLPHVPDIDTYLKLSNQQESVRLMAIAKHYGVRGWFGGHYHSFSLGDVEGTTYVLAGGGGGRHMPPTNGHFFVEVSVNGSSVTYTKVDQ